MYLKKKNTVLALLCRNESIIIIQWNPYIADTIGELHVGRYRGLAVAEGFYKY